MIRNPISVSSAGVIALTVACVPTGMNTGVSKVAWGRVSRPQRAVTPGSVVRSLTSNANAGQSLTVFLAHNIVPCSSYYTLPSERPSGRFPSSAQYERPLCCAQRIHAALLLRPSAWMSGRWLQLLELGQGFDQLEQSRGIAASGASHGDRHRQSFLDLTPRPPSLPAPTEKPVGAREGGVGSRYRCIQSCLSHYRERPTAREHTGFGHPPPCERSVARQRLESFRAVPCSRSREGGRELGHLSPVRRSRARRRGCFSISAVRERHSATTCSPMSSSKTVSCAATGSKVATPNPRHAPRRLLPTSPSITFARASRS